MTAMSIPYELTGRTEQKARTRKALIAAARDLLADGVTPTVEQAAERAAISRTTAFRYFQNQRALVLATYPELEEPSLLASAASADPVARLETVADHFLGQIVDHEPELRAQLRLSLEPTPPQPEALPLRQGRGIGWYEDALAPLRDRMTDAQLRRLALAIRATTGIEALVWLTDIAGLSRDAAIAIMRSSALTLARSAITDTTTPD
jgi:AcrR family transcriptional regulator